MFESFKSVIGDTVSGLVCTKGKGLAYHGVSCSLLCEGSREPGVDVSSQSLLALWRTQVVRIEFF
jgi:hypothetical protein